MKKRTIHFAIFAALIGAATAAAHWPALDAQSLFFDDHQYLVGNPLVRSPSWHSASRFLGEVLQPSTVGGYYQPLAMISLMLDCALGGDPHDLRAFHRTSLALHVANTILIAALLYLLFGDAPAAALAALLFGVHPLTVEPIPWVGERKTLLATFFALLSLIAYVNYARGQVNRPRRAGKWFAACAGLFVLALLSKPTSTPLPLAMLLMDYWPLRRFSRRAVLEKIPLLGLSCLSAVITYVSQAASYVQTPAEVGLSRIPLILCHNIIFYLWKMVWPVNLSSGYPFPDPLALSEPTVRAGVIGTIILLAILLVARRWTPAPLIGWLIFFVLIIPTMGVIGFTIVIASDKYVYLPTIGLLMALAHFLMRIRRIAPSWGRNAATALCLILAAIEIPLSRSYLAVWQTDESLYGHLLARTPNSATLHFGLGYSHAWHGRIAEATDEYRRAVELDPGHVSARNNLALYLFDQGRYSEAAEQFRQILRLTPGAADIHNNLALTYNALGRPEEAIRECKLALEAKPDCAPCMNNLGAALNMLNRPEPAAVRFRDALRVDPDFTDARSNLAETLWRLGRLAEAQSEYQEWVRRQPTSSAAHLGLGRSWLARERPDEAVRELRMAVELDPTNRSAAESLAAAIGLQARPATRQAGASSP